MWKVCPFLHEQQPLGKSVHIPDTLFFLSMQLDLRLLPKYIIKKKKINFQKCPWKCSPCSMSLHSESKSSVFTSLAFSLTVRTLIICASYWQETDYKTAQLTEAVWGKLINFILSWRFEKILKGFIWTAKCLKCPVFYTLMVLYLKCRYP